MRIYLDNCCYNRPFDAQGQTRVQLETIAKLSVQLLMALGRVEYVWSSILEYEVSFNPSRERAEAIMRWKANACAVVMMSNALEQRAAALQAYGIKHKDALHIASAEQAHCDWLLTTDDALIRKAKCATTLRVGNPIEFVMENSHD